MLSGTMNFMPDEDVNVAISSVNCGSIVSSAGEVWFVSFLLCCGGEVFFITNLVALRLAFVASSSASMVKGCVSSVDSAVIFVHAGGRVLPAR